MSFHALDDFQSRRPGFRTRPLIGTKHGFTSFFVSEFRMAEGGTIPLHTHPIEEAIVVTEGALTVQLGDETVTVPAGSVVRVPPGVAHAFHNHAPEEAHGLGAAAHDLANFFTEATTYLEGGPSPTYLEVETPPPPK
jgi:quercetin dioxygenase-like cupin family protein